MLYDASMTRFGIRKKLKRMARALAGGEAGGSDDSGFKQSSSSTPTPPKTSSVRAESAGSLSDSPGPSVSKAPPAGPLSNTAPPQSRPAVSPPVSAATDPSEEPGAGTTWEQLKRVKPGEVDEGTIRRIEVFGNRMALARVADDFFVVQGKCPHGPGQLGDGALKGHLVTCPVHGLEFDVRDGTCVSDPDMVSAPVAVKVKGERVFVMVPE